MLNKSDYSGQVPCRRVLIALMVCTASIGLGTDEGKFDFEVDIFVSVDCPIANAYAPEINRLYEQFREKGFRFRLIYPDTTLKEKDMNDHRKEYSLQPEAVLDRDHSLVERAGASITPEVAVFDRKGALLYRGKIDNRYTDYGDKRRVATEKYLEDTLQRLVAGETIEFREVKAIGCLIEPLPK